MALAGEYLTYELYRDSARSEVWGSGPGSGLNPYAPSATAPNAGNREVTVYGRVPGGQEGVSSGLYTDTVVATINF
jgi:spore coat protein U-like protein